MDELQLPHRLTLDERSKLTVTGVSEVVSFDDTAAVLHTSRGTLVVQGDQLQLKTLSPEGGQVVVEGNVTQLLYEHTAQKGGFFSRLLR